MTLLDRLLEDRKAVLAHRSFIASEGRGPFDELSRVLWREPSGATAITPWGPTSLVWAVARTALEIQDGAEAEAEARIARIRAFTDEQKAVA